MTTPVRLERDGDVAVLVIDNPPVNAGSQPVRAALLELVAAVDADPGIVAAVLIGAGKSFIAGSDLKEFDLPLQAPQLPAVIGAIEKSAKPFVAALHGAALGGGYELSLACDWRLAAPGTVVGLPEVTLGIIPGAGGTQKLPRLTGVSTAIGLICSGRRVEARTALGLGMIDAVAEGDLREDAVRQARSMVGSKRRAIDLNVPEEDAALIDAAAAKALRAGRNRPHVALAIAHVRNAATLPAAEALAAERAAFEELRIGPEARALRHVFFAEREAAKGSPGRASVKRDFSSVGVVGAGTMGAGIALCALQAGKAAVLIDADAAALERGRKRIEEGLDKAVANGLMNGAARDAAGGRLTVSTELAALADCDVVIEAIIEVLEAKQAVFRQIDAVAKPDALLATNTSYLDIDAIAEATSRPQSVIGLHFFSPAHIMKLLEVVAGRKSSANAVAGGLALARALGKQPVEARNGFGFIGNRIYAAYRASCEFMLEDGALPHEVDAALEGFGFAMGPFAVADLSGLDIAWRMRQQQAETRSPSLRYVAIADRLCEAGRFGRKTGAGYYRYGEGGKAERDAAVEELIVAASAERGIARRPLSAEQIQRRALAAIVSEAAALLGDGIAHRPGDVDVVMVNGYGFPRWTGGPLHWARQQDPAQLIADCADFARQRDPAAALPDLGVLGLVGPKEQAS